MPSLVIRGGPRAGQQHPFDDELIIGRDAGADLILDDPGVSRRHVSIRLEGGAILAEDLGSSNGTLVNGHRLTGPVELTESDELRLGGTTLAVRRGASPAGPGPVPRRLGPDPQAEGNLPALAAAFCGPLSIFLLVFSTGAAFFVCLPIGIAAVLLGSMGIRRADADPSAGGRTLARVGRITGLIGTALSILALIAFVVVITALDTTEDSLNGLVDSIRDEIEGAESP